MSTFGPRLPRLARITLAAALAAAFTTGCGGSSDDDDDGGGAICGQASDGPPVVDGLTAAHNTARAAVEPPADRPLPALSWSPEIAAVAQAHAERCVFEHSQNSYGENLYATSGSSAAPEDVVATWVREADDYDFADNTCSGTCGHYTQVVWADSLRIGCGVADCTCGSPFGGGAWQLWVCNYDPPGNVVGQRPY